METALKGIQMSNQAEIGLGKIITGNANRDAIHIAIAPVVASCRLVPSQNIGFIESGNQRIVGSCDNPIGIVDPFLNSLIFRGQKFWMFLYPDTITSLRHDWTHPAFETTNEEVSEYSEEWLRGFAEEAGMTYVRMIEVAEAFIESGDVWVQQGHESARDAFYNLNSSEEFWKHIENVTGKKVSDGEKDRSPFCCTC